MIYNIQSVLPMLSITTIMDRERSWDKFALLALLHTHQTQIQLYLPNLAPHPPYNVNSPGAQAGKGG